MPLKHTFLFEQGDATYREDGLIQTANTFGIVDAVGTPYDSPENVIKYDGLSSGEKAARTVELVFTKNQDLSDLRELVDRANRELRSFQKSLVKQSERLAGVCLAVVRLNQGYIDVVQIGDCFAVIEDARGELMVSSYLPRGHELANGINRKKLFEEIAKRDYGCVLEKVPESERSKLRQTFWREYPSVWMAQRRLDLNRKDSPRGYGLLNGQKEYQYFLWHVRLVNPKIRRILLCTDGMISPEILETGTDMEIGRWLLNKFNEGGWPEVLAEVRSVEKERASEHYTSAAEASGYSLEFSG